METVLLVNLMAPSVALLAGLIHGDLVMRVFLVYIAVTLVLVLMSCVTILRMPRDVDETPGCMGALTLVMVLLVYTVTLLFGLLIATGVVLILRLIFPDAFFW